MSDDLEHPPRGYNTEDVAAQPAPRRKRSRWKIVLFGVIGAVILLCVLYVVSALKWSYSDGWRAGYVQKFSRKGIVCKTWEGELSMVSMPGTSPEKFAFTVRNDSIARLVQGSMGKFVRIHYDQHKGVPTSCFGDTEYYVNAIQVP